MIETIAKFDKRQRISIAVLGMIALALICYGLIIRTPVAKLAAATQKRDDLIAAYTGTEIERTNYTVLQTERKKCQEQLAQEKQRCFSPQEALSFYDNMNAMARTYNLESLSSVIPKSTNVAGTGAEPGQDFLESQSAHVEVAGDYFDIVNLIRELGNRPQKVFINKMSIQLPSGQDVNPTASFEVACLVNLEPEVEE